jgi:hypothetical protein
VPALLDRVHDRGLHGGLHDLDAGGLEHGVEGRGGLRAAPRG